MKNDLESRFIDQWCALFGQFIGARLDVADTQTFDCLEERLWDMVEITSGEVHRAFFREVLSRIAEVAPEASKRIADRMSRKKLVFGDRVIFGEEGVGNSMGDTDFKERFIAGWCRVFSQLLQAQLNGSDSGEIAKLRHRYQSLAEISGPDVTQEFFREVISRTGEVRPDAAARLLKSLLSKGIIKGSSFSKGKS